MTDKDSNETNEANDNIHSSKNPSYRYICHTDIQKIYVFDCKLEWKRDDTNTDNDDGTDTEVIVTKVTEPTYPSNDDIVSLLMRFSRGFLYGLLGLKEMFPNNGRKGTCRQHKWYREFVSEGIVQIENCDVPSILSKERDMQVYAKIPALENYWFSALVDNLLNHMHFAIAYDINTDADDPDGNYHVVVRHGKQNTPEDNTTYWLYGNEPENPERKLVH